MNKRRFAILTGAFTLMLLLSSCSKAEEKPAPKAEVYEEGITVSNNVPVNKAIIITGEGLFEAAGSKKVMVIDPEGDETFEVINVKTDETVFTGRMQYKRKRDEDDGSDIKVKDSEAVAVCDLSDIDREGSYYIRTGSGTVSNVFTVSRGLYKKLLADRLSYFGGQPIGEDTVSEDVGQCYMRITDRLLAQEFFPEAISPGAGDDERIVPRTMLLAKSEIDILKGYYDPEGNNASFLHSNVGSQYQYAAVFAMFAYNYNKFDKAYAAECAGIAEAVYDIAEKNYERGMYSSTDTCDDKRFWASAQLYKLTGGKPYRETAESYAGSNPKGLQKGLNEDTSGYFGSVAYLTCYYPIDLEIAEKYITTLMNDINAVVKESSKSDFLAAAGDGSEEEEVRKVFGNARLMVLGNYISKSITYVECGENQLAYLYGRNELGKDYAYSTDSEFYNEPQEFILAGLIDSYIYEDKKPEAQKNKNR